MPRSPSLTDYGQPSRRPAIDERQHGSPHEYARGRTSALASDVGYHRDRRDAAHMRRTLAACVLSAGCETRWRARMGSTRARIFGRRGHVGSAHRAGRNHRVLGFRMPVLCQVRSRYASDVEARLCRYRQGAARISGPATREDPPCSNVSFRQACVNWSGCPCYRWSLSSRAGRGPRSLGLRGEREVRNSGKERSEDKDRLNPSSMTNRL